MPSLKVSVNHDAESSFQPYDGPDLVKGSYNAVIKQAAVRQGQSSGNPYLNVLLEVDEPKGDKSKYNGAPLFGMIFLSDNENVQARLSSFLKAIGGKSSGKTDVNIAHESEDAIDSASGSKIRKIDGVNPVGKKVRMTLREEQNEGYGLQIRLDTISSRKDEDEGDEEADTTDEEIEVEDDEDDEEDVAREDREKELKKESLADLKAAAKEAELDIKGLKKAEIIEAILDWEYEDSEDEDGDEDDEDDDEEEIEVDEDEDDEDDEEEEDEEDEESTLRSELADLDRSALKKRLAAADSTVKVKKSDSDDDVREKVVAAELNKPPF